MSYDLIADGATAEELGVIFGRSRTAVQRALEDAGVRHCNSEGRVKRWRIADVASVLYKPDPKTIRSTILKLKASEIPPALSKEFWDAEMKRQKWLTEAGKLWREEDVVQLLGEVFKTLAMGLQLLSDAVERETGLTETQRRLIESMVDDARMEMRNKLIEDKRFTRFKPASTCEDSPALGILEPHELEPKDAEFYEFG